MFAETLVVGAPPPPVQRSDGELAALQTGAQHGLHRWDVLRTATYVLRTAYMAARLAINMSYE